MYITCTGTLKSGWHILTSQIVLYESFLLDFCQSVIMNFFIEYWLNFHFRAYDPAEYEHLPVGQDIKELFQYITRYVLLQINLYYSINGTVYCDRVST